MSNLAPAPSTAILPTGSTFAPHGFLQNRPRQFFMTLRDIALWLRSARTDASLNERRQHMSARDAFNQLYDNGSDPFFANAPQFRYQRQKYDALLAMLPKRPYRNVLDIGCGLGGLSRRIAPFADQVVGVDIADAAIAEAARLTAGTANLRFLQWDFSDPDSPPIAGAPFDLIFLADTIYYLSPLTDAVLKSLALQVTRLLAPGGLLMLANHFFFHVDPASRMTRRIHDGFRWSPGLELRAEHVRPFYLTTILERMPDPR